MTDIFKHIGRLSFDIAWVAVILFLPITSLPLLSRLAGNTMVAPASFLPLVWLLLFWFIYYILNRGCLPRESIPLIFFVSMVIISSAFAFFLNTPSFKSGIFFKEATSAFLTLLIGLAFYFVTSAYLTKSQSRIASTFKLINISGAIMLLWAIIQAIFIFGFQSSYPIILQKFQHLFSTRGLFIGRMTAFAFEPSWFGHQLNLLFLPFWLAASITGWSAFRFRLLKISFENILLVVGMTVLFLSSRIGTLSFLMVLVFLVFYFNIYLARFVHKWTIQRFEHCPSLLKRIASFFLPVLILFIIIGIFLLVAIVLVYGLSHVDSRLERIFQITSWEYLKSLSSNSYILFNFFTFAERYVYWVAGWNIFNSHPFLGVGLGNAGFYFQHALPSYSWSLPEVMDVYYLYPGIPNIKSFWVRLLAETGIIGFSSFIAWCYVLIRVAWSMRSNEINLFKMVGWVGLFVMIAFVFEGFSTDTFALPYLWISLGIISAAGAILRNRGKENIESKPDIFI